MTPGKVLATLERAGSTRTAAEMKERYGIPTENAFGVPMAEMQRIARTIGTDHRLARRLWDTGNYEARTVAVFISDPAALTRTQMDRWAGQFDSWAICDTACFHLFDRSPHAWSRIEPWARARREFVRRAAFALVWGLSVHDKQAGDAAFLRALRLIGNGRPDDRPLVMKAVDMALRAVGKRNRALNRAAVATAKSLVGNETRSLSWIGRHALRELESAKVRERLRG